MTNVLRKLLVQCPTTQEMVFTGRIVRTVDLEKGGIRGSTFRCPVCNETHAWDAQHAHDVPVNPLQTASASRGW